MKKTTEGKEIPLPALASEDIWVLTMLLVSRSYHEREAADKYTKCVEQMAQLDEDGIIAVLGDLNPRNDNQFYLEFDRARNIILIHSARVQSIPVAVICMDGLFSVADFHTGGPHDAF